MAADDSIPSNPSSRSGLSFTSRRPGIAAIDGISRLAVDKTTAILQQTEGFSSCPAQCPVWNPFWLIRTDSILLV